MKTLSIVKTALGGGAAILLGGCPNRFTAPNLAADLFRVGKSFAGYAEDLPGPGLPAKPAPHVVSARRYAWQPPL
jgi:hypothetical protein